MFSITVSYGSSAAQLLFKTKDGANVAWTLLIPPAMTSMNLPGGTSMEFLRSQTAPSQTAPYVPAVVDPTLPAVVVADDFGRTLCVIPNKITGIVIEDLEQSKVGQVEMALHQARTQAEANKRGMSDPVLTSAARLQTGPAVLSPMGNGRNFQ